MSNFTRRATSTETSASQLDTLVQQLEPILKHITLHRFLWLFTMVCALIAWNRGLMLLYALVAFLLAILLISYVYYFLNLSTLRIKASLPKDEVMANETFSIEVQLDSRIPQHFVAIDLALQRVYQADIASASTSKNSMAEESTSNRPSMTKLPNGKLSNGGMSNEKVPNGINDKSFSLKVKATDQHATLFVLHSRGQQSFSCQAVLTRGVYRLSVANLQCAYPLGIVNKQRMVGLSAHTWTPVADGKNESMTATDSPNDKVANKLPINKLTVDKNELFYVLPVSFPIGYLPLAGADSQGEAQVIATRRGTHDEFADIRRYRRGDALKTVHWGASARQLSRGKDLMVKNYDTLQNPHALIVLNQFDFNLNNASNLDSASKMTQAKIDTMITLAVSFARYLTAQNYQVSIVGFDEPVTTLGSYWQLDFMANTPINQNSLRKLAEINGVKLASSTSLNVQAPYSAFNNLLLAKRPNSLMVQFFNHMPYAQSNHAINQGSRGQAQTQGQQHRVYLNDHIETNRIVVAKDNSVQYEIHPQTSLAELQTLFGSSPVNLDGPLNLGGYRQDSSNHYDSANLAERGINHAIV